MIDIERAPYGALLLRVSMGVLFILHGVYLKGCRIRDGRHQQVLRRDGFAWVVMLYETLGGLALILGIYLRWVAVFLGIHLLVVSYVVHAGNGWLFTNTGGGYEFPVFWAIACFTAALLGPGAHSLVSPESPKPLR